MNTNITFSKADRYILERLDKTEEKLLNAIKANTDSIQEISETVTKLSIRVSWIMGVGFGALSIISLLLKFHN